MSKQIETIELRGSDYAKVSSRIKAFHEEYDSGSINTDYQFKQGWAICKASITLDIETPKRFFTGHSMGKVNEDKAFEKLESVAVGRALANAGFLASGEIATAEEMQKFDRQKNNSSDNQTLPDDVIDKAEDSMDNADSMNDLRDIWTAMPDKVKTDKRMQTYKNKRKQELTKQADND